MKRLVYLILLFVLAGPTMTYAQSAKSGSEVREDQLAGKASTITISFSNSYLYLFGVKEGTKVEVVNMLGVPVLSVVTSEANEKISLDLKKGFYVVRVENYIQRIVVK